MNASSETWQLGDQAVQVSRLEKVYWPQTGFTKGDLLGYYRQITPVALPHLIDRPVLLPLIDTAGLLWFANQGAIEFHLWGSRLPDLTQPDLAIFDLDPGKRSSFDAVREAALRLHDALTQAGVRESPKTSGGDGLHVFVPLGAKYTFERVRAWAKAVGGQLASNYPDLIALAHGATHQRARVTVQFI